MTISNPLPPTDPEDEIAELRALIAILQAELSTLRQSSTESVEAVATLRAALDTAREELAALKPPTPKATRLEGFFEVEDEP